MSIIATPMITSSAASPAGPQTSLPLYRLSVEQYHAMAQHGILTNEDRVELLDGLLVSKEPMNPPHRVAVRKVRRALELLLTPVWYADSQVPITLSESEPLPDVVVARAQLSEDITRHPGPGDLALVVEVADTTLPYDRGVKKLLYARESIAIYWIVNLEDAQVEVHTTPSGPAAQPDYASRTVFAMTDEVPVVLDGTLVGRIPVRDLLP